MDNKTSTIGLKCAAAGLCADLERGVLSSILGFCTTVTLNTLDALVSSIINFSGSMPHSPFAWHQELHCVVS
eukprot:4140305-Amphidinium_carterae.1